MSETSDRGKDIGYQQNWEIHWEKIEIIWCWYATGYLILVSTLIKATEVAPLQVPAHT